MILGASSVVQCAMLIAALRVHARIHLYMADLEHSTMRKSTSVLEEIAHTSRHAERFKIDKTNAVIPIMRQGEISVNADVSV